MNKGNDTNKGFDPNKKSHFIMIPIEDQSFVEAYNQLVNNIKSENLQNISPYLFQKDGKLHMTVCTLNIGEESSKLDKYLNFLSGIEEEVKKISSGGVNFNFDGYSTLGEGANTRVLYVKMKKDDQYEKLGKIIDFLISRLVKSNLLNQEEIEQNFIVFDNLTNKYSITVHLTILNVLFWNKILKKNKQKPLKGLNSTQLLDYLINMLLPNANINCFNFCRMREDKNTEKYEIIKTYYL